MGPRAVRHPAEPRGRNRCRLSRWVRHKRTSGRDTVTRVGRLNRSSGGARCVPSVPKVEQALHGQLRWPWWFRWPVSSSRSTPTRQLRRRSSRPSSMPPPLRPVSPTARAVAASTDPAVGNASSTCAPGVKGYDCMSLAQYAVYQGTGIMSMPGKFADPSSPGRPGNIHPAQRWWTPATSSPATSSSSGAVDQVARCSSQYKHSGIYAGNNRSGTHCNQGHRSPRRPIATVYGDYGNVYDGASPGTRVRRPHVLAGLTAEHPEL